MSNLQDDSQEQPQQQTYETKNNNDDNNNSVLPENENEPQDDVFFGGKVEVKVLQAKDLVAMDKGKSKANIRDQGTSDPYAKIFAGDDKSREVGKTKNISKNLNPVWNNESFSFSVTPHETELIVELFDYDGPITQGDSLGQCAVDLLHGFGSTDPVTDWYDLKPTSKRSVTGKVQLTVTFLPAQPMVPGSVTVKIPKAKGLAVMDKGRKNSIGSSDPFFKIFRETVMSAESKKVEMGATETVSKNLNPEFPDFELKFDVGKYNAELIIEGFDYDGPIASTSLGQATIPLREYLSGQPQSTWFDLVPAPEDKAKGRQVSGSVMVEITFEKWEPFPEGSFLVEVIQARELMAADTGKGGQGSSDPFAKVFLENRRMEYKSRVIGKTDVVKKNLNPEWKEKMEFDTVENDKELIIEVFDHDLLSDTSIGQTCITSSILLEVVKGSPFVGRWFDLVPSPELKREARSKGKFATAKGAVQINLSFVPWVQNPPGIISMNVVEARNILATDTSLRRGSSGGTSDPFAKIFLDDRRQQPKSRMIERTETVKKSLAPKWNHKLKIDSSEFDKTVTIELFDEDRTTAETLGQCVLTVKEIASGKITSGWISLVPAFRGAKAKGEVFVELAWTPWVPTPNGTLTLKVVSGTNLLPTAPEKRARKSISGPDSHCSVFLDQFGKPAKSNEVGRTPTVQKSNEPQWNKTFSIDLHSNAKNVTLLVSNSENTSMGQTTLNIKDIIQSQDPLTATHSLTLEPSSKNSQAQGSLNVSWEFTPWVAPRTGKFVLKVLEAKGLRVTDRGNTSDPFVTVFVENRDLKPKSNVVGKSSVVQKSVDPTFPDASFSWSMVETDKHIRVEINDYDGPMSTEQLGYVILDPREYSKGVTKEWFKLSCDVAPAQGKAMILLRYDAEQDSDDDDQNGTGEASRARASSTALPINEDALDIRKGLMVQTDVQVVQLYCRGLNDQFKALGSGITSELEAARQSKIESNIKSVMARALSFVRTAIWLHEGATTLKFQNKLGIELREREQELFALLTQAVQDPSPDADKIIAALAEVRKTKSGKQCRQEHLASTILAAESSLAIHRQNIPKPNAKKIQARFSGVQTAVAKNDPPAKIVDLRQLLEKELAYAGLETDSLPSPALVQQHTEAFSLFKDASSGRVPKANVWLVMMAVGQTLAPSELDVLLTSVTSDGLAEKDFLALMEKRHDASPEKEAAEAFLKFDKDGSGTIDVDELSTLINNLGVPLTLKEVQHMMADADHTGQGALFFNAFTKAI